jgi:hypothetical protein
MKVVVKIFFTCEKCLVKFDDILLYCSNTLDSMPIEDMLALQLDFLDDEVAEDDVVFVQHIGDLIQDHQIG